MFDHLSIWPASYEDLPDVTQIHVASWQQTYIGQVPQPYLDNLDVASRLQRWRDQFRDQAVSGLWIARVNNIPAGFICFGRAREQDRLALGEIYAVYLLREHWGEGIGYRLYKTACAQLQNDGFRSAYLWVLNTNHHAIRAYERWGGVVERDRLKDHVIAGQPVKEVSVLFSSIDVG